MVCFSYLDSNIETVLNSLAPKFKKITDVYDSIATILKMIIPQFGECLHISNLYHHLLFQ